MTILSDFREAMATIASAVYLVTGTDHLGRPRGFTATSVVPHDRTQGSLLVSIDQSAYSHDTLVSGDRFGLTLLADDQQSQAELFASKRADKFDNVDWELVGEVPIISRARAYAVCRAVKIITYGDHTVLVGTIESTEVSNRDSLVYWRRGFLPSNSTNRHPEQRKHEMTTVSPPSINELVRRAEALLPSIRERAGDAETSRSVHSETIKQMREADLLQIYQPRRYGGTEMPWGAQIEISRVLGRACGSTAWLASVLSTHSAMVGRMSEAAQDDVWADDPMALVATGSARTEGIARPADGGYMVHGGWRFASGIDHSQWVMVPAPIEGLDAEGPAALRQFLIPASEYEIVDDWHVSGLSATGSKKVQIFEPVFVPTHRSIGFLELQGANPPGASVNDGYVYRIEFRPYFGTILLGPILGAAEGALNDYLEATRTRVGAIFKNRIADSLPVQLRVAESAAEIAGAGRSVDSIVDMLHRAAEEKRPLSPSERVESMRDRAFIARRSVDAVHRLVRQMGASGLANTNPVQRHFRDISAMSAQIGLNWDRNAGAYGKWALGIPTGDRTIDGETSTEPGDPSDSLA